MEVTCPNCDSRFNLAEGVAKPGAKLRCSVCQNVFSIGSIPAPQGPQDDDEEKAKASGQTEGGAEGATDEAAENAADDNLDLDDAKSETKEPMSKKKKIIMLVVILLLLCAGGGGGWWYYSQNMSASQVTDPAALAKSVELMTMRNVRQYYVQNEKIGAIFVIEGLVVNEFPVPKDLIEVEAAIYGKDKATLMTKKQLGGTVLSLFQLQVLGEEELESFLSNQIEILTKNTNVPPKGEVPFMVLFYNPPPEVAEFGVKIVSAKDIEQK